MDSSTGFFKPSQLSIAQLVTIRSKCILGAGIEVELLMSSPRRGLAECSGWSWHNHKLFRAQQSSNEALRIWQTSSSPFLTREEFSSCSEIDRKSLNWSGGTMPTSFDCSHPNVQSCSGVPLFPLRSEISAESCVPRLWSWVKFSLESCQLKGKTCLTGWGLNGHLRQGVSFGTVGYPHRFAPVLYYEFKQYI